MPASDEAIDLARAACAAADDKLATDLAILEVADVLGLVEVFMLCTTNNERQLKAVAENVEDRLRVDLGRRPLRREGTHASGWYLLDYGDLVCHVFAREQREYYDLDRLWGDVAALDPESGRVVRPALERA